MTDGLAGPWVLVVGMHRSGTSAVTGALGAMGLNEIRSEDRMDWPESNPEHWESLSLGLHDEDLLNRLGGSWDGPPDFPDGWEHSPEIREAGDPTALIAEAFPAAGPSVWKDPRLCLLLPYWREMLPAPVAAVFVWRQPLAVAHSLRRRDQLTIVEGIALWERYNRAAIEGLQGVDTYVLDYESVVEEPDRRLTGLVSWLSSLEQFRDSSAGWDVDLATAVIARDLHHAPDARPEDGHVVLQTEQLELVQCLKAMSGGQRSLRTYIPLTESAWTTTVLRARPMISALNKELDATKESLRIAHIYLESTKFELDYANHRIDDLHASTSWKVTKPVRTVAASLERARHRPPES
jgi:hypothetical protein